MFLPRIHHLYPENSSKTHQIIPSKGPGLPFWSTRGSKKKVTERIDQILLDQSPCVVERSHVKVSVESVGLFLSISDRDRRGRWGIKISVKSKYTLLPKHSFSNTYLHAMELLSAKFLALMLTEIAYFSLQFAAVVFLCCSKPITCSDVYFHIHFM